MSSSWQRPCGSGNCVSVNIGPVDVLIRDTKDRDGPFLAFSHAEYRAFLAAIEDGELRIPTDPAPVTRKELHREIARLAVEVDKLRATLRHPSSRGHKT